MTFDMITSYITKVLDVLLVWAAFYYILKTLRKNVKMVLLFKGVIIIIGLKLISVWFNLVTVGYLLDYVFTWAPLAVIVIFQPEIRNILEHLGRTSHSLPLSVCLCNLRQE